MADLTDEVLAIVGRVDVPHDAKRLLLTLLADAQLAESLARAESDRKARRAAQKRTERGRVADPAAEGVGAATSHMSRDTPNVARHHATCRDIGDTVRPSPPSAFPLPSPTPPTNTHTPSPTPTSSASPSAQRAAPGDAGHAPGDERESVTARRSERPPRPAAEPAAPPSPESAADPLAAFVARPAVPRGAASRPPPAPATAAPAAVALGEPPPSAGDGAASEPPEPAAAPAADPEPVPLWFELHAEWMRRIGVTDKGRFRKAVAPLCEPHGVGKPPGELPYPPRVLRKALQWYAAIHNTPRERPHRKPEQFVANIAHHVAVLDRPMEERQKLLPAAA